MEPLIRRKSGGQPRNQNARKHGLYSKVLAPDEKRQLKYAVGADGLDQEIAILRLKFRSLLAQDGQNLRLINQTARTLARLYSIKFRHSRNDSDKLKEALARVHEEFVILEPAVPSSNSSPSTGESHILSSPLTGEGR